VSAPGLPEYYSGANPRRMSFSVTTRGKRKFNR
jgi:hypothetical protein